MNIKIITHADFYLAINKIDQEFVYDKGRQVSLRTRFPNVLNLSNCENIFVACIEGEICGMLAIQEKTIKILETNYKIAFIGMVWVDKLFRGQGIGLALMKHAENRLVHLNVDCGVLWTNKHNFYANSGWKIYDTGVFSEVISRISNSKVDVECLPLDQVDINWLEHIRHEYLPIKVIRDAISYQTLPLPVQTTYCFYSTLPLPKSSYALVGADNNCGYVYEVIGDIRFWNDLLIAISKKFNKIYVNLSKDDPFLTWLEENHQINSTSQNTTMWLPLSRLGKLLLKLNIYVPYLDRI